MSREYGWGAGLDLFYLLVVFPFSMSFPISIDFLSKSLKAKDLSLPVEVRYIAREIIKEDKKIYRISLFPVSGTIGVSSC